MRLLSYALGTVWVLTAGVASQDANCANCLASCTTGYNRAVQLCQTIPDPSKQSICLDATCQYDWYCTQLCSSAFDCFVDKLPCAPSIATTTTSTDASATPLWGTPAFPIGTPIVTPTYSCQADQITVIVTSTISFTETLIPTPAVLVTTEIQTATIVETQSPETVSITKTETITTTTTETSSVSVFETTTVPSVPFGTPEIVSRAIVTSESLSDTGIYSTVTEYEYVTEPESDTLTPTTPLPTSYTSYSPTIPAGPLSTSSRPDASPTQWIPVYPESKGYTPTSTPLPSPTITESDVNSEALPIMTPIQDIFARDFGVIKGYPAEST